MGKLKVGDEVIAVDQSHEWGSVKAGDEGVIIEDLRDGTYRAKFPSHQSWRGKARCFKLKETATTVSEGRYPFDLERALAGEKVVTRDGKRNIVSIAKQRGKEYTVRAETLSGMGFEVTTEGKYFTGGTDHNCDLFMAFPSPVKETTTPIRLAPFDREMALAGHPVVTRKGDPVTDIRDRSSVVYCISARVVGKSEGNTYTKEGRVVSNEQNDLDLFMLVTSEPDKVVDFKKGDLVRVMVSPTTGRKVKAGFLGTVNGKTGDGVYSVSVEGVVKNFKKESLLFAQPPKKKKPTTYKQEIPTGTKVKVMGVGVLAIVENFNPNTNMYTLDFGTYTSPYLPSRIEIHSKPENSVLSYGDRVRLIASNLTATINKYNKTTKKCDVVFADGTSGWYPRGAMILLSSKPAADAAKPNVKIEAKENIMATTPKTKIATLVAANKSAAITAAKIEAGTIAVNRIITLIHPKVPMLMRGYLDTPVARVVVANLFNIGIQQYAPTNEKAALIGEAMMEGSMLEFLKSFKVEDYLDQVLAGVDISKLTASADSAE